MYVFFQSLPAASARFWTAGIGPMLVFSAAAAFLCGYVGLLVSYHANLPSGPSIILTAGALYVFSVAFGRHGGLVPGYLRAPHYQR